MGSKRRYRLKGRKPGSAIFPDMLALLSEPGSLRIGVGLRIQIGNPPFDKLNDDEEGIATGIKMLRGLWPLHREEAIARCIKRFGAGRRPELFWDDHPNRPYVKPRDWLKDASDHDRFMAERLAADLAYLRERKLLSADEEFTLANPKPRFGPPEASDEIM